MEARVRRHFERTWEPGTGRFAHAVDARIAPGGDRVAFAGSICDDLDAGAHTRIGLARDGASMVLTSGPNDDRHPRWSPDGRSIAFLSDRVRGGQAQLVLLDVDHGGESSTPWIDGVVEFLEWSQDGQAILLGVAGLDADRGDVRGPGPARNEGRDTEGAHGSEARWRPSVTEPTDDDRSRCLWIYDVGAQTVQRLPTTHLNVWEATWCGTMTIVAVASRRSTEGSWFEAELRSISIADGSHRPVYRGPYQIGVPVGSPSGGQVAVISGLCSDRGVVAGEIVLVDLASGDHRILDAADTDVTDLAWLDDRRLAFLGIREQDSASGSIDSSDPDARASIDWVSPSSLGRHVPRASFSLAGSMAVVRSTYATYPSVVIVAEGAESVAASLEPSAIPELLGVAGTIRPESWEAPDGVRISGWLCIPPGPGPYPMVLHVHGGPVGATMNAWDMGNDTTRLLVESGYAVLHPNPRGSFGRGQAFVRSVMGEMGGDDADDLLSGLDAMVARGYADPARLVVLGTSYGGYMANLLPTRTDRFAAAVAMSPVTDWESFLHTSNIPEFAALFLGLSAAPDAPDFAASRSPLTFAERSSTPTLEVVGMRDLCTPAEQAIRFFSALAETGTPCRLVTYPEAGHGVQHLPALIDLCSRVLGWLDAYVMSASSPDLG